MPNRAPVFMQRERKPWVSNHAKRKITGSALQKARAKLFAANPLCAECEKQGRTAIARIRDHIIPLAFGGLDIESNTQGLCEACHSAKTAEESKGWGASKLPSP
jgi:5-methylcytosine-specific restriction enzyme A